MTRSFPCEPAIVTMQRITTTVLIALLLICCGNVSAQATDPDVKPRTTNTRATDRDAEPETDDDEADEVDDMEAASDDAEGEPAEDDEQDVSQEASTEESAEEAPAAVEPPAPPSPSLLAAEQTRAAHDAIIGSWRATIGRQLVELELNFDNTFSLNSMHGTFERLPGQLVLHPARAEDAADHTLTFKYRLVNDQLELSEGDLEEPVTFIRQFSLAIYLADMFNTNVDDIWQRFKRIGFIIVVVLVANVVIAIIRVIAHLLIFSEWGPLALIYRERKNRAKTIYSIVLNLVKYFIYFTALGMILSELGVNYMTYVASLSVIGLAVGFGSQGLVQDMVTGFFIIFEGQFDVGDMVEISGQSGYVIDLGLRMTKLRNYLGQIVVIPNRNIAMVGNYSRSAQRAYIDVQVPSPEVGTKAMTQMQLLGEEILKQFEGAAMGPLKVTGPWSLSTGEHFVRLHLSIWPNQTWLVTEQIIPRIRDAMKRQTLEITNERVTAYYHPVAAAPVKRWPTRLKWRRRKQNKPVSE